MSKIFQLSKNLTINQEYKKLFLLLKILKHVLATVSSFQVDTEVPLPNLGVVWLLCE
jgi:hypothetical protein